MSIKLIGRLELNVAADDPTGSGHKACRFRRPSSTGLQVPYTPLYWRGLPFCLFVLRFVEVHTKIEWERPSWQHQRERVPESTSGIVVLLGYFLGLCGLLGFLFLRGGRSRR